MISVLIIARDTRGVGDQRKDHMKTQEGGGCRQAKKRGFRRNQTCWHFDLEFAASRTRENKLLLFKPSSVWYFPMETHQAKTVPKISNIVSL